MCVFIIPDIFCKDSPYVPFSSMYPILQIGLEGSGSPVDFLLAVVIWVGVFVVVLILGKLVNSLV